MKKVSNGLSVANIRSGATIAALVLLGALAGCENNDDPVDELRDSAEEVGENINEAANDTRRKIEDLPD